MKKTNNLPFFAITAIVIITIASRFIPHPFNFTAIGAIALFSGAVIRDKRYAFLIPLFILFLTDLIIGFHFSMLPVYGCFMFTVWMGTTIKNSLKVKSILFSSLISSMVFYLVTNLPFWYLDLQLYPMTLSGTLDSYVMALPFFRNQVLGDLFYNLVLFGSYLMMFRKKEFTDPAYISKK
jgi:hypothetical protein